MNIQTEMKLCFVFLGEFDKLIEEILTLKISFKLNFLYHFKLFLYHSSVGRVEARNPTG